MYPQSPRSTLNPHLCNCEEVEPAMAGTPLSLPLKQGSFSLSRAASNMDLKEMFTDLRLLALPLLQWEGRRGRSSWKQEARWAAAVVASLSLACSCGVLHAALELVRKRYLSWEHAHLESRMT